MKAAIAMYTEPQPCKFHKCGFVPEGDSARLDERHYYCVKCSDTVHLFAHVVGHSRFGSCKSCGTRHTIGVKDGGWREFRDKGGNLLYGVDGVA